MKDNKHPHHDLIVEWAKDTSKVIQSYSEPLEKWVDFVHNRPDWDINTEYRLKPREFTKGHWYPCVDKIGEHSIYMYTGKAFSIDGLAVSYQVSPYGMKWIGESLGEINFPS